METFEPRREYSANQESILSQQGAKLEKLRATLSSKDFYARLEVQPNATNDEIKQAFRKKFASFHPDNKPNELRDIYDFICRLLSEAKFTLIEPLKRVRYDKERSISSLQTQTRQTAPYHTTPPKTETYRTSQKESKEDALRDIKRAIFIGGAYYFMHIRDMWVRDGIITKEEVNNSKDIKDIIVSFIKSAVVKGGNAFKIEINQWIKVEAITREEIIKLPEIKNGALKNIKDEIFLGPYCFQTNMDNWIEVGIVTKEEIIKLSEIKKRVIENIKQEISLEPENFQIIMDGWIEVGIVTKEEIIKLPEIKKKVLDLIEPQMIFGEARFRTSIQPWIVVGVITQEETEKIIKDFLSTL